MKSIRGFASDNNSGISPEVINMIREVNQGHVIGYGDDIYTKRAIGHLKEHFGDKAEPYFVFTGTAANVLSIAQSTKSYNSVICAETSHIHEDECGAPEKFSGCKLLSVETPDGKLSPSLIGKHMVGFDFEHHSQPGIVSISQPTEMGTVYTVNEIKALADFVHSKGLLLHIDGARLANAAVSLGRGFKAMTTDVGVDLLSFGGTKNGLMAAESIIFLKNGLSKNFKYLRKQGMQLASKMRFISAQFIAYLENDLWFRNAQHANEMAQKLYRSISTIPQIKVTQKVQANGVFAIIPKNIIPQLKEEFFFYTWNEAKGEVRWMTSFDTTEQDITEFVKLLKSLLKVA